LKNYPLKGSARISIRTNVAYTILEPLLMREPFGMKISRRMEEMEVSFMVDIDHFNVIDNKRGRQQPPSLVVIFASERITAARRSLLRCRNR
jgi:hypothetical protein